MKLGILKMTLLFGGLFILPRIAHAAVYLEGWGDVSRGYCGSVCEAWCGCYEDPTDYNPPGEGSLGIGIGNNGGNSGGTCPVSPLVPIGGSSSNGSVIIDTSGNNFFAQKCEATWAWECPGSTWYWPASCSVCIDNYGNVQYI